MSDRRMRHAIPVAVAWGTLVECFPYLRTQYRRPAGCRDEFNSVRGPTSFFQTDADVVW